MCYFYTIDIENPGNFFFLVFFLVKSFALHKKEIIVSFFLLQQPISSQRKFLFCCFCFVEKDKDQGVFCFSQKGLIMRAQKFHLFLATQKLLLSISKLWATTNTCCFCGSIYIFHSHLKAKKKVFKFEVNFDFMSLLSTRNR